MEGDDKYLVMEEFVATKDTSNEITRWKLARPKRYVPAQPPPDLQLAHFNIPIHMQPESYSNTNP